MVKDEIVEEYKGYGMDVSEATDYVLSITTVARLSTCCL